MAIPEIDASIERIIEGKRQAGRYFFRWELPKTGPQFDLFESLDRTTLDIAAEVFWHSGFSHSGFLIAVAFGARSSGPNVLEQTC